MRKAKKDLHIPWWTILTLLMESSSMVKHHARSWLLFPSLYLLCVFGTALYGYISSTSLPAGEPSFAYVFYILVTLPWSFFLPFWLVPFGALVNAGFIGLILHRLAVRGGTRETDT